MSDSKKTGVREGKSRLAESKWMVDACHLVLCVSEKSVLSVFIKGLC